MAAYAHPEALVSTQWVADHLHDPHIRLLEAGWDTSTYASGHIPGAVGVGLADLHQPDSIDILSKPELEALLSRAGVAPDDTVILYGEVSNLIATLGFWMLTYYGHADVRLLDGGRQRWIAEGRVLTTDLPVVQPTAYVAQEPNELLRADVDLIRGVLNRPGYTLVDARSTAMYVGDDASGTARGGHIPGAINIPATMITDADGNFLDWQPPTTHADGTFRPAGELRALLSEHGVAPDRSVITYCLRGGLSTHLWFVLTQLLDYPDVREYDRSWLEWGNLTDVPVEK